MSTSADAAATGGEILIVDDDPDIIFALSTVLERAGFVCLGAADAPAALARIAARQPRVLFLDVALPGMDGLALLEQLSETAPELPVIVITGQGTMDTAIRATQLGAYDYLTKPLDAHKIRSLARKADEVHALRERLSLFVERGQSAADEMVGQHPAMQEVYKAIGAVVAGPPDTTVLIQGETGTGKELVARAIHQRGSSAAHPLVAVNCASLPEALLEAELFGHERGAFTGAHRARRGKLEIAAAGTFFLDEIGELAPHLQQKLLRVLQERCFERLGGNVRVEVRARFITATNADLAARVAEGSFRRDLFFRLNVFPIRVPPLRERRDDIPLLVEHFLRQHSARIGRPAPRISQEAMACLVVGDYPGNVRELENLVERCVILVRGVVLPEHLPEDLQDGLPATPGEAEPPTEPETYREARCRALAAFERSFVEQLLRECGGNVTAAARQAGIERQSFQRLMRRSALPAGKHRHPKGG